MPDLASPFAAGHTRFMQARPGAAGLTYDAARDEPRSARVAEARSRARERRDAQRQALRPLGVLFIAVVVTASAQTHPAPALRGAGLGVLMGGRPSKPERGNGLMGHRRGCDGLRWLVAVR
jgi:hypothetical protein